MAVHKVVRGNFFEDFEVGHVFRHHWGRTINEGDNSLFSTVTLNFLPAALNKEYAQSLGYAGGALSCLPDCTHDFSACTQPDTTPPADVTGLRRTDVQ